MRVISGSARGTVLHSIEDISTRPTLDRVKESLFNIIQNDIEDTTVLDLFAGSGAKYQIRYYIFRSTIQGRICTWCYRKNK